MNASAAIEAPNVAASIRKPAPAPAAATIAPPSAGPITRMVSGRMNCRSAAACTSWSLGSTCGTSAV